MSTITTPLTELLGIKYPIMLAGMNVAAGPELAAAVTNAGGIGVIGGIGYTPKMLQKNIDMLKAGLDNKNAPFGVDLLLPKVGGSARKTNYDYTKGHLPELVDIIINSGASLFVSAVGVPPRWVVDKMHAAGIPVMNMIGAPKHVAKAIAAGVDIICAQGGEGGGHTGDIPTSVLIPKVVDLCRGHKSPLTGKQVCVVAAGGIFDGRGLAMSLCFGADAVWVGTRFVASEEAGAPARHKKGVVEAGYTDTVRTLIYTGRPLRVLKTGYIMNWEDNRQQEIKELCSKGVLPFNNEMEKKIRDGVEIGARERVDMMPLLMGSVAGAIDQVLPAKQIVDSMMSEAIDVLQNKVRLISRL